MHRYDRGVRSADIDELSSGISACALSKNVSRNIEYALYANLTGFDDVRRNTSTIVVRLIIEYVGKRVVDDLVY